MEGDDTDAAMALYLKEDTFGQCMRLPVVRLNKGSYVIGLLKYNLRDSDCTDSGLQGGATGMCLTDMLIKVYWKQINQIEAAEKEGKAWHEQVAQVLQQHGASEEILSTFNEKYVENVSEAPLEKLLAGRARAVELRQELQKRDQMFYKRMK